MPGGDERAYESEAEDYERPNDVRRPARQISRHVVTCAGDQEPERPDEQGGDDSESAQRPGQP